MRKLTRQTLLNDMLRVQADVNKLADRLASELQCEPASDAGSPAFNERQIWALGQIRSGVRFTRKMIEKEFGVTGKTAKRDLGPLIDQGTVVFVRKSKPGHYLLTGRRVGRTEPRDQASGQDVRWCDYQI